jgi:hypothetical protein
MFSVFTRRMRFIAFEILRVDYITTQRFRTAAVTLRRDNFEGNPTSVVAFTNDEGFALSASYFTVAVLWS